jgi:hypothetical protein
MPAWLVATKGHGLRCHGCRDALARTVSVKAESKNVERRKNLLTGGASYKLRTCGHRRSPARTGLRSSSQRVSAMMARIGVPQCVAEPLTRAGRHQIQEVRIIVATRSLGLIEQNALGSEIWNAIGRCCNHLPPLPADVAAPSEDPVRVVAGLQKDLQPPNGFHFIGNPKCHGYHSENRPQLVARRAAHQRPRNVGHALV